MRQIKWVVIPALAMAAWLALALATFVSLAELHAGLH